MINLGKIHETIKGLTQDPQVDITKIDNYTFDIVIKGDIMPAFEKLGEVQKQIEDICSEKYSLKTVYGDSQNARFIINKN